MQGISKRSVVNLVDLAFGSERAAKTDGQHRRGAAEVPGVEYSPAAEYLGY
jgi:hypothetical protein